MDDTFYKMRVISNFLGIEKFTNKSHLLLKLNCNKAIKNNDWVRSRF